MWATLLVAGGLSSLFLIRNLGPTFVAHIPQHASVAIGLIGYVKSFICNFSLGKVIDFRLVQMIFAISIKVCFYYSE